MERKTLHYLLRSTYYFLCRASTWSGIRTVTLRTTYYILLTMQSVYVERKTHREDWWGDGEASAKERFPLAEEDVVPFLEGRFTPEHVRHLHLVT